MTPLRRVLAGLLLLPGLMLPARPGLAAAQISPGPLARPHQSLTGTRNCLACHGTRRDAMDAACLDCHKEIGFLRAGERGLHGRPDLPRCAQCHPDHAGTGFNLTGWTRDSLRLFDHRRAGWVLEGRHGKAACEDCHAPELRTGPAATLAPGDGRSQRWTGLEASCASCHEDVHKQSLGTECADCHDSDDWVPARRFDHDRTDYPLTGRHETVDCAKCHQTRPRPPPPRGSLLVPEFTPIAAAQCSSCHRDPHGGRLGGACADCHLTTGFAERRPGSFNHDRTRYPLAGRHATVSCDACHGPPARRATPRFDTCAACHADRHQGTATLAGAPVDCATCHDTRGFAVPTLGVSRHAETRYPLEGQHVEVACTACHRPQADGSLERPAFPACAGCHANPHGEQLAALGDASTCERCHALAGWTTSGYPIAEHAATGLPLEAGHAALDCAACHAASAGAWPGGPDAGEAGMVFRIGATTCAACHADPHRSDPDGVARLECRACHAADAFRPARVTATLHEELGYALRGAHRAVPCDACHESLAGRAPAGQTLRRHAAPPPLDLRLPGQACAACHATPHGDQFADRRPGGCDACHTEDRFTTADRFDHQRDAAFSLLGAHAAVPCRGCHPGAADTDGVERIRWRPLSGRCEDCHDRRAR